uniref:Cyclin N-terminal domain-containing protein n=1 Tax=Arcella intermedia TaxID=1963864 RepID=A0A6B2LLU0_9EUKA
MAICIFKCLAMVHAHPSYHSIYDERLHKLSAKKTHKVSFPTPAEILDFILKIEDHFNFPSEVYVISSIYMDRLATISHIYLDQNNWKRVVLISLVVAAKYMIDTSIRNCDFIHIFPHVTDFYALEKEYLKHIHYRLFVERLHYNVYYFAVNSMNAR